MCGGGSGKECEHTRECVCVRERESVRARERECASEGKNEKVP